MSGGGASSGDSGSQSPMLQRLGYIQTLVRCAALTTPCSPGDFRDGNPLPCVQAVGQGLTLESVLAYFKQTDRPVLECPPATEMNMRLVRKSVLLEEVIP
jgi:hypothetical protein